MQQVLEVEHQEREHGEDRRRHGERGPEPAHEGGTANQWANLAIPWQRSHALGIPMIVGEWGVRNDDDRATADDEQMEQLLNQHGISWARWDMDGNSPLLGADHQRTPERRWQVAPRRTLGWRVNSTGGAIPTYAITRENVAARSARWASGGARRGSGRSSAARLELRACSRRHPG